jgi:hypothetical protein
MKKILAVLAFLLLPVAALASTSYEDRPGPVLQLEMADVLTADAVSDGSTTAWIPVRGWNILTLEMTLTNAAAQSLTCTMTGQACNSTTNTCAAANVYTIKALTITTGAATVNTASWVSAHTATERWPLSIAVDYRYVRFTWTCTGSPLPAVTLAVNARVAAMK